MEITEKDKGLTKLEPNEITIGYWKARGETDVPDHYSGHLACVTDIRDQRGLVSVEINGRTHLYEPEEFLATHLPAPEGAQERAEEMARLMAEISDLGRQQNDALRQLAHANPHLDDSGNLLGSTPANAEDQEQPAPSVPLEPTGLMGPMEIVASTALGIDSGRMSPLTLKKEVAGIRNLATRFGKEVKERQQRLQMIVQEQAAMLAAQAKQMQEVVGKLEEAIWTINLYLGKDEEIVRIAKGTPAPPETPITIRQLVLFMDEECAIASESGGIDAVTIEQFDNWLRDPEHLQQVLPEAKGMVAAKVRRNAKDYGNPWTNSQMAKENSRTYFLMRNGNNIYRMYTDFDVGTSLIPTEEEMQEAFTERHYDQEAGEYRTTPVRPGSSQYMKILEKADAKRRHYLRVGIILQGLLDRTPIFKPLPVERLNICNPSESADHLHFIRDGENLLGDGRPGFYDWLGGINAKLNIGMRVMGLFRGWQHGIAGEDRKSRIWPSGAELPEDAALYTIEKKGEEPDTYYIYYDRGEIWTGGWSRYTKKDAEVRARCTIEIGDDFVLNFDAASIDDMEYYLQSRTNRSAYTHIFPLLKSAIRLKRREQDEEAPFKKLLTGMIINRYNTSLDDAEQAVEELVPWWKFKNQTHRALTDNDTGAIKTIVAEYGIRQKRRAERLGNSDFNNYVVNFILEQHPDTVLIGHKSGNEYVALDPMNNENIWVRELLYRSNRSSNNTGPKLRLTETKPWSLVDKRHERWETIYSTDRWGQWAIGARRQEHLTDQERDDLLSAAMAQLEAHFGNDKESDRPTNSTDGEPTFLPIAARRTGEKLEIYFCSRHGLAQQELLLSNQPEHPVISVANVGFEMKQQKGTWTVTPVIDHPRTRTYRPGKPLWENAKDDSETSELLWVKQENVEIVDAEFAEIQQVEKKRSRLRAIAGRAYRSITAALNEAAMEAARQEYLAEYGDPELWEDHKKNVKPHLGIADTAIDRMIDFLVERNNNIDGMTVRAAWELAVSLGWDSTTPKHSFHGRERTPSDEEFSTTIRTNAEADEDD